MNAEHIVKKGNVESLMKIRIWGVLRTYICVNAISITATISKHKNTHLGGAPYLQLEHAIWMHCRGHQIQFVARVDPSPFRPQPVQRISSILLHSPL